ncbi:hypothetical protein [Micromonospora rubida]
MTALATRARALAAGRLVGALADLRAGWLTADDLRPLLAAAPADLRRLGGRGRVTRLKVRVVPGALTVLPGRAPLISGPAASSDRVD